jgi:hypothetical protein
MDFSLHTKERIQDRRLNLETIVSVLEQPDAVLQESDCKQIFHKIIKEGGSKYLYRIFLNICKQPPLVITAYKTSKIDKYEY